MSHTHLSEKYNLCFCTSVLKGPQSKIGLFQKLLLHPYITLKNPFSKFKIQKKTLKKVRNFGALARTSYVTEMTVAGLKIDF